MKVICAWCRREGRPGFLGEREPLDDPGETTGICRRHQQEVLEALPSTSFPGVRVLVVVSPREARLHQYLQRAFGGLRDVLVMVDRRQGERRRTRRPVAAERRRQERRIRSPEMHLMGYAIVRFGKPAGSRRLPETS